MSKWYTADDHSAIAEQGAYKPEGDMWTLPKGLPGGVKEIGFFRARDVFAKAEKKEPQFVDVRFLPINLESADGVSRKQRDQVGGERMKKGGGAVCVNVAEWIAKRLVKVVESEKV